jgi:phosphoserine phosphatase
VAFNAKPVVQDAADTSVSVPYLDAILFVLGIRRGDVVAADLAEPTGN